MEDRNEHDTTTTGGSTDDGELVADNEGVEVNNDLITPQLHAVILNQLEGYRTRNLSPKLEIMEDGLKCKLKFTQLKKSDGMMTWMTRLHIIIVRYLHCIMYRGSLYIAYMILLCSCCLVLRFSMR